MAGIGGWDPKVLVRQRIRLVKAEGNVFFFQAEDGIRDIGVTGVQTCALPISASGCPSSAARCSSPRPPTCWAQFDHAGDPDRVVVDLSGAHVWNASSVAVLDAKIGRASCRERV